MSHSDRRSGHMDSSIVVWIVLILVAIALPTVFESLTGRTLTDFWRALPEDRTRFMVRSLLLGVAVLGATFAAVVLGSGRTLRTVRDGERIVIPLPQPGVRTFGAGLCVLALYTVVAGVIGQGPFWWTAIVVGVVFGALGLVVLGTGERVVVAADRVVWESLLFRSASPKAECAWDGAESPEVSVASHQTGGAFGQPVTVYHTVQVAGRDIRSGTDEDGAEALRQAIAEALADLRGEGRDDRTTDGG